MIAQLHQPVGVPQTVAECAEAANVVGVHAVHTHSDQLVD